MKNAGTLYYGIQKQGGGADDGMLRKAVCLRETTRDGWGAMGSGLRSRHCA